MKRYVVPLVLAAAFLAAVFASLTAPQTARAHRDGCHRWHSCPSDTGSYVCGDLGYTSECPTSSAAPVVAPTASAALSTNRYPRCSALNRRYPHGVGKVGARDHTSGTPVTTFKRSNLLYGANSHLDRDKDRVACEKA
jgi:Excalibur calcium-binding domain